MSIRIRSGQTSLLISGTSNEEDSSSNADSHFQSLSTSKKIRCTKRDMLTALAFVATGVVLFYYSTTTSTTTSFQATAVSGRIGKCAILFWGLPRAFDTLVLPSILKNVIRPNSIYACDYYVHFYTMTKEEAGRSGAGGFLDPEAIYSLKKAVIDQSKFESHGVIPVVDFIHTTDDAFWSVYATLIDKIRNTKDPKGNYLYFPWKAKTYIHPTTTDNIIKMWHTIQSVWNLMEGKGIMYEKIAMLRSDVVYVTPIDIMQTPTTDAATTGNVHRHENKNFNTVVIPNFGNHPVSDRLIYGSYDAVKVWATERFRRLETHVAWVYENDPGWGLHSERFMNYTIFPAIRNTKTEIIPHPTLCFFRARTDGSVWISDCEGPSDPRIMQALGDSPYKIQQLVEELIGFKCGEITKPRRNVKSLNCSRH